MLTLNLVHFLRKCVPSRSGACFLKAPKSQLLKCNLLVLKSWSFDFFFNVKNKKNKTIAKFGGLELRRCLDKRNYDTRKISGFFEK